MVYNPKIRVKRIEARSRTLLVLLLILICTTAFLILTQRTVTWKLLTGFTTRPAHVAAVFRECRQFSRKERINWNYLYYYGDLNTRKSLIWCKVPKAGSTTLTKMFLRLAGARNIQNSTKIHRLLRTFYPQLSTQVMSKRMRTTFKFLVVRDPFERILSAYRDKLESYQRDLKYRDGFYYNTYGRKMLKTPAVNGTIREPTFEEFVDYLISTGPREFDEHWMPISRLCAPCNVHYDAIVRMEKFNTEIKLPLREAGIFDDVGWAHSTGTSNKQTIEKYFKNLTLTKVQKLYQKYKKDFILFGYSPNKYFSILDPTLQDKNSTHTKTE